MCAGSSGTFVAGAHAAFEVDQRPLVIYYANDTPSSAPQSPNYQALIGTLSNIDESIALKTSRGLWDDARNYQAAVKENVSNLIDAATHRGFSLAVFTTEMAAIDKFLLFRGGIREWKTFNPGIGDRKTVFDYAPLSYTNALRSALSNAIFQTGNVRRVILIIDSHGTKSFAVIPRVAADFTGTGPRVALDELASDPSNDMGLHTVPLHGISKIQMWSIINEIARSMSVDFPLVFSDSCESGIATWGQYWSLPRQVGTIVHSGFGSTDFRDVNYARLSLAYLPHDDIHSDLTRVFSSLLSTSGFVSDTGATAWRWPLLASVASVPLPFYFLPGAIWIAANITKLIRWHLTAVSKTRPLPKRLSAEANGEQG